MTTLVIGIVLIVGGIAFAAFPFFKRPASGESPIAPPPPGPPTRRVTTVDAASTSMAAELEELDLDRAMGKLDETDYQRLRAAIERRATGTAPSAAQSPAPAAPSRAETVQEAATVADAPPVGALSSALSQTTSASGSRPDLEVEAERLILAERAQVVTCGTCGPRPEPGARFCSRCGRAIGGCPACGATIRPPDARFCDQCGTAVAP